MTTKTKRGRERARERETHTHIHAQKKPTHVLSAAGNVFLLNFFLLGYTVLCIIVIHAFKVTDPVLVHRGQLPVFRCFRFTTLSVETRARARFHWVGGGGLVVLWYY